MASVPSVGAFMQGFLNGYKAMPDADDRAYKKLKNEHMKAQIEKLRRPAGGGKPARNYAAQDELARARAKTESEKQEYYRWKREQKAIPQPSETDNVEAGIGGPASPAPRPVQAIPATPQPPGGWPGPQSAAEPNEAPVQTAENEPDEDEDQPEQVAMAGDVGDDDGDEVSAARGGAIPPRNYAEGGDVEDDPDEEEGDADEDDKEDDAGYSAAAERYGANVAPTYSPAAAHDAVRDGITATLPPQGAVAGPAQSAAHTAHLRGANAASQVDMDRIRKKVDPEGKMDESDRNMAAFSAVQQYYLKKNDPEAARAMSASMVGYFRQQYDRNRALASVAAEHGDIDKAISYAQKSYVNVPDGMKLDVKMDDDGNYIYAVVDGKTGEPAMKPETVTPEVMLQKIQQGAQQTFNGLIAQAAGMRQEKEAKPAKGPAEPKQSDYHAAETNIEDVLGGGKLAPEAQKAYDAIPKAVQSEFKSIATDVAARNRVRPYDAVRATSEIWDGDVKSTPLPGGARTYRLPDGREYTLGRNAALQLDMVRAKAAETKKAEEGKASEKKASRAAIEKKSAEDNAALMEAARKRNTPENARIRSGIPSWYNSEKTAIPTRIMGE